MLPSFTVSLLTGFVCKWAERERENKNTELPSPVGAEREGGRQRVVETDCR